MQQLRCEKPAVEEASSAGACMLSRTPTAAHCCCPRLSKHQIARRRKAHQEKHPDAKIISLGEGRCMWA